MNAFALSPWKSDWAWSLPLIVVTVIFHAYSLWLLEQGVSYFMRMNLHKRLSHMMASIVIGGTALCTTVLHGLEAAMWTAAYLALGALPDQRNAMLYSLNAMTTYGHAEIDLE